MPNRYENSFNYYRERLGALFGQPFQIYTVDYTAADQTMVLKSSRAMYKVEVGSRALVQNPLPNGSYYCVHGKYNAINAGDVLVPLRSDSSTPTVTIVSKSPFEEITAVRSSRICDIYNGSTPLYTNCLFDYSQGSNFPEDPIHRRILASPKVPENMVIMRRRALRTATMDTEGLLLIDKTDSVPVYWQITQDNTLGDQMLLTLAMSVTQ